jgi:RNA polymerase sigma factor (sigma-70 family)
MSTIEFNELLIANSEVLKPYAINFTRDREEAKDLMQETIFRALANRDKFNDGTNIQAWLSTIMRNIFINRYRRKTKAKKIFQSPAPEFQQPQVSLVTGNIAESRMRSKEILEAVHILPDRCRIPFNLYFEGYQYQEIADIMDIALGTIKSRIHLARKLLKQQIAY